LVIPSDVSLSELRKADLLLHERSTTLQQIVGNFFEILLYLSFKSNVFNVSYQADNAGITQMIVFQVLAS
jgi:hypothetical protein